MNHLTIIKSSLKLAKFKALVATTTSALVSIAPLLLIFASFQFDFRASALPGTLVYIGLFFGTAVLSAAQLMIILGKIIEGSALDTKMMLKYLNAHSWKNVLNLPAIKAFQKQSKKTIINLRILEEKSALTDSDYEYLAYLIQENRAIGSQYQVWLSQVSKEATPRVGGYLSSGDVALNVDNKIAEFEKLFKFQQINTTLELLSKKVDPERLSHYLLISEGKIAELGQLDLLSYAKLDNSHTSADVAHLHKFNNSVLSSPSFVMLNEKNYKELNKIILSHKVITIDQCIQVLLAHDWPKVDWPRVKSMLINGYTAADAYYHNWYHQVNEKVGVQTSLQGQNKIISNVGSSLALEQTSSSNFEAPNSAPEPLGHKGSDPNNGTSTLTNFLSSPSSSPASALNDKAPLDAYNQAVKYCDYIKYIPQFNAPAWAEMRQHYDALIANPHLENHVLLELNSRLNTVLPLIISSDKILSKNILLEASTQSALDLMLQNLTMLSLNVKELRAHVDATFVQELQAVTNYQKMKVGK